MILMRPLIEILEDERRLMYELERTCQYMIKTDDPETLETLKAKTKSLDYKLQAVRAEMKQYLWDLLD
jgi:hypothetical protein